MHLLIGELNKGKPLKGTLLNWLNRPLGKRNRPLHWIRQGEEYYTAVERVRQEREHERRA